MHAMMRRKKYCKTTMTYTMTPITAIRTEELFTFWESIRTDTATVPGCPGGADLVVTFAANKRMFGKIIAPLAKVHGETVQCGTSALLPWHGGFLLNSLRDCGINRAIRSHDRAGGTDFSPFHDESYLVL
jgi:hypothetical protein